MLENLEDLSSLNDQDVKKQLLRVYIEDPDREITGIAVENTYDANREKIGDVITIVSKYSKQSDAIEIELLQ